ncbi:hypothetical protein F441_03836 [Phytophthora nicotianae CJ01A1]|uniref:RxLR effector protein n=4 Tax=Phytophthora nicotianae TaxID=4792 RepID=V9FNS9_PHYNI|nr:hypothetical protein F443_03859 [Phytophthora nicotianae P1569]ETO81829.1 hypothetical protein F444_03929 [Phytophthora nicotianae P1976]ETP22959.1 hypothetical protein F441_03836 [Phytophthora nicotianae CJ01A1]ETP50937.1 hypothetical protein F442_03843 [Phytophthora nicotianae P10297]
MTDSSPMASMWRALTPVSSTVLALLVATVSASTTVTMQLMNLIVDARFPSEHSKSKQEMAAVRKHPSGPLRILSHADLSKS